VGRPRRDGRADLARWDAAYDRMDDAEGRPWFFIPAFVAVGRRPLVG
jgi:hypothetical protein